MSDLPQLDQPSLPFWMGGDECSKLASAAHGWFTRLGEWAALPARQLDPLTCTPTVLDLLAWQRNVTTYKGEPERLYRLRVAHAYANARDAGSVTGWGRIFQRLELGGVALEEWSDRHPASAPSAGYAVGAVAPESAGGGPDELASAGIRTAAAADDAWDIIGVVVDDTAFPDRQNVLEIIVQEYGRTCRRYRFISRIPQAVRVAACAFDDDHATVCAVSNPLTLVTAGMRAAAFDNSHHTTEAHA
ncbi:MAG: phage tail protein [Desulfovibrio sp.]|jgi:phage tail P2-like protein|nr:phage tail protein [Desulfovibrio sp.]